MFILRPPVLRARALGSRLPQTRTTSGTTRRTRLHTGNRSSGLANRIHSDGFVDANGIAVVRPMVLGEQSVRIAMDPNGRGHYVYSITPRTFVVTGTETEDIVLEVGADRLRKSLDRMKKR